MKPILFIFPLCQVTPAINLWGQSGKILTMYASRCALAVLKYITTPNSCTLFTYPSFFFADEEERGRVYSFLSVCFHDSIRLRKIFDDRLNISLNQLKITNIKNVTQPEPCLRVTFVLCNHISKTIYCDFLAHDIHLNFFFGSSSILIKAYIHKRFLPSQNDIKTRM